MQEISTVLDSKTLDVDSQVHTFIVKSFKIIKAISNKVDYLVWDKWKLTTFKDHFDATLNPLSWSIIMYFFLLTAIFSWKWWEIIDALNNMEPIPEYTSLKLPEVNEEGPKDRINQMLKIVTNHEFSWSTQVIIDSAKWFVKESNSCYHYTKYLENFNTEIVNYCKEYDEQVFIMEGWDGWYFISLNTHEWVLWCESKLNENNIFSCSQDPIDLVYLDLPGEFNRTIDKYVNIKIYKYNAILPLIRSLDAKIYSLNTENMLWDERVFSLSLNRLSPEIVAELMKNVN